MSDSVFFLLDGKEVQFTAAQSILKAATNNGFYIPHLCFHPNVSAHGSCRLCIVNINGKTVSACTTPAEYNINVISDNENLKQQRLRITQMLFVEGNHYCPTCEWSGNCQLQAIAYDLGMTNNHYPMQYPTRHLDATHPDFILDHDRCIHCGLCERAAKELDHKNLFSLSGRGINSYLSVQTNDGTMRENTMTIHDKAAHICPVGALLPKSSQYQTPLGQRLYDSESITIQGNHRPEDES